MIEVHPYRPFVPNNTKYLFLGTFTGKKDSLKDDWFFGTKRTQFWKILEAVYVIELNTNLEKENLFKNINLAITDVILSCERRDNSNLDNNLINITFNLDAISDIFKLNRIEKVYFSSRNAEGLFKKNFKELISKYPKVELITLPSPSPRYAAMTFTEKVKRYKELLPKLI